LTAGAAETCDYCGAATLEWRKCKLVCTTCNQINKSCADLSEQSARRPSAPVLGR